MYLGAAEPHDANAASRAVSVPALIAFDLLFADSMERSTIALDHKAAIYVGDKYVGTERPKCSLRGHLGPANVVVAQPFKDSSHQRLLYRAFGPHPCVVKNWVGPLAPRTSSAMECLAFSTCHADANLSWSGLAKRALDVERMIHPSRSNET